MTDRIRPCKCEDTRVQVNGDARKMNWVELRSDKAWGTIVREIPEIARIAEQYIRHAIYLTESGTYNACPDSVMHAKCDLDRVTEFLRAFENPTPSSRVRDIIRRAMDMSDTTHGVLSAADIEALEHCAAAAESK